MRPRSKAGGSAGARNSEPYLPFRARIPRARNGKQTGSIDLALARSAGGDVALADHILDGIAQVFGHVLDALVRLCFPAVGDADLLRHELAVIDLAAHHDGQAVVLVRR